MPSTYLLAPLIFSDFPRICHPCNYLVSKRLIFYLIFSISVPLFAVVIPESNSCNSFMSSFLPKSFGGGTQRSSDGGPQRRFSKAVTRINSPGQRFTATHGISAKVRNLLTLQLDFYNFLGKVICAAKYVLKQILTNYKWLKGHYLEFQTKVGD